MTKILNADKIYQDHALLYNQIKEYVENKFSQMNIKQTNKKHFELWPFNIFLEEFVTSV